MKKVVRIFIGLAGFALLALGFAPMSEHHAAASNPAPVTVTNTPLPVQGTVSIGNTPSINVANTPSVHVSNSVLPVSGNVSVLNSVDSGNHPVPLLVNSQIQAYQDSCNTNLGGSCPFHTIPNNMRLVIQEVDLLSNASPTAIGGGGSVDVTINGTDVTHRFVLTQQGGDSTNIIWIAHQPTTLYADPNTTPSCDLSNYPSPSSVACAISGYLVAAQ